MNKYKITRINCIAYHGRKKISYKTKFKYLAKSKLFRANGDQKLFEYVNFRGSRFKNSRFVEAKFAHTDFRGANFTNCNFQDAVFDHCIFLACNVKKCKFKNATFKNVIFINNHIENCTYLSKENLPEGIEVISCYPDFEISVNLKLILDNLKKNIHIRKTRVLHLPNNKYNKLNLFLLNRIFDKNELEFLLSTITENFSRNIVNYYALEWALKKSKNMLE